MQKQHTQLQEEEASLRQGVTQDHQRALQEGTPDVTTSVQKSMTPRYPAWPTSKPGPQSTPPPQGTRPATPLRSEQVVEVVAQPGTETFANVPASGETEQEFLSPKKPKERL